MNRIEWFMDYFNDFILKFNNSGLNIPSIGIRDILDIFIVAYIVYKIIFWIKETRAWVLFKGIIVIGIFTLIANFLRLNTIVWILSNTVSVGIITVIVIFQPELRKALEQIGKGKMLNFMRIDNEENTEKALIKMIDELIKASDKMSAVKTGALMLIEHKVPLGDLERTGIPIDAIVSSQLLINIFEKNTPLHDGAVIIRNKRVAAATCFLPLTESTDVSMELGTRHRAGIGASEVSDADVIIVSEETGAISLARSGVLYRNISSDTLRSMLMQTSQTKKKKKLSLWKGRQTDEKN